MKSITERNPQAFLELGAIYASNKDYKNASHYYTQASQHFPDNPNLKMNAGQNLLKYGESLNGEQRISVYKKALNYFQNKAHDSYQNQIAFLEEAISNPHLTKKYKNFKNRNNLRAVYERNSKKNETGEYLERLDKLTHKDKTALAPAYVMAGTLYARRKQLDQALDCFNNGLKQYPSNIDILFNKISVLFKLNRGQEGHKLARHTYSLNPEYTQVAVIYAIGLCLRGKTEETQNIIAPFLQKISKANSMSANAQEFFALHLASSNATSTQIKQFQIAAKAHFTPKSVNNIIRLSRYYTRHHGKVNNKIASLDKAVNQALSQSNIWEELPTRYAVNKQSAISAGTSGGAGQKAFKYNKR